MSENETGAGDLGQNIGACLQTLLERGFELPLRVAVLAINGAVLAGTYDQAEGGGLAFDIAAEAHPPEGYALPINLMWVDAGGQVARAEIAKDSPAPRWVN